MATTNKFLFTDSSLTKVCKELINNRIYDESLVKIKGNPYVTNGIASDLSSSNYFYWDSLYIPSEEVTVSFKGNFAFLSEPQCAWALTGDEVPSIALYLTNSSITLKNGEEVVCRLNNLPLKESEHISLKIKITKNSYEIFAFQSGEIFNNLKISETEVDLSLYNTILIGAYESYFWGGNIDIASFSISNNVGNLYTPSKGTYFNLSKIMISDGTYPLSDDSKPVIYHVYEFGVKEITRSGNTLLVTAQIDSDAYLNIKQVGLYDTSGDKPVLFGLADNLTINKTKGLSYDLVFTVDLSLSIVNIVGFPDIGSFVVEEPEYAKYSDFRSVEWYLLYVLTNLERIIRKNAYQIGYNRSQVFYKLQQDIAEQEYCYNTLHTYTKLEDRFTYRSYKEFDPSTVTIVGSPNIENGIASNFSSSRYLWNDDLEMVNEDWEAIFSFRTNTGDSNNGEIGCFTSPCINQPLELYIEGGFCKASLGQLDKLQVHTNGGSVLTYERHPFGDTPNYIPPLTFQNEDGTGGTPWNFSSWDIGTSTPFACWRNEAYSNTYISRLSETGDIVQNTKINVNSISQIRDWTYIPTLDTSRSWSISVSFNLNTIDNLQYILDSKGENKTLELFIENGKLKFKAYKKDNPTESIFGTLETETILSSGIDYTVTIGFNGYEYSLKYLISNYTVVEEKKTNSSEIMNWGEPMTLGGSYSASSNNLSNPLIGTIDLNQTNAYSNYEAVWIGVSPLNLLFTNMVHPSLTDVLYDIVGMPIEQMSIADVIYGKIYEGNLFPVVPDHNYFVKISSTFNSDDNKYHYSFSKSNNGYSYDLITTETSNLPINEFLATYLGILPTYDNLFINGFTNPLSCKLCLLDWLITIGGREWKMYKDIIFDKVVCQYYNIPTLPFSTYKVDDLHDNKNNLEIFMNQFEGNGDIIDFNNEKGISLLMKVHLKDMEDKILLVKRNLSNEIYFIFKLQNQVLSFLIYTGSSIIKLEKEIDLLEYEEYEKNPILITITYNGSFSNPEFNMYKNNELIKSFKSAIDPFQEIPNLKLFNFIDENDDNKGIYVSDILLIERVISQDDLYFINNLMDTNY